MNNGGSDMTPWFLLCLSVSPYLFPGSQDPEQTHRQHKVTSQQAPADEGRDCPPQRRAGNGQTGGSHANGCPRL